MDQISSSTPPPQPATSSTAAAQRRNRDTSVASRLKKGWLWFTTSFRERIRYIKAIFLGQTKKMMAKDEKEATEADLQAAKMQVEAADDAERTKMNLEKAF
ncbi:uncharacterized protein LOC120009186 [Tripterygium wilfordii]|uniref:uncharacterized protein LOC120009186 n=1 Tax=Tripterygium wilfordii TaxID=458696 RepID=UPI0018F85318|nr:uncharacterized protein LOC120009186 [Tripterygium wilfordii]